MAMRVISVAPVMTSLLPIPRHIKVCN